MLDVGQCERVTGGQIGEDRRRRCAAKTVRRFAIRHDHGVVAGAAVDGIAFGVHGERVVAVAADHVVDAGAIFDEDVVGHPGRAGPGAGIQVNRRISRIETGQVERIIGAIVVQRDDRFGVVSLGEVIHRQRLLRTVTGGVRDVAVETKDLATRQRLAGRCAIKPLGGEDIEPHWSKRRAGILTTRGGRFAWCQPVGSGGVE